MTKASQSLRSLMPSLRNHNTHMQNLLVQAKEALNLPYENRMKKFRSLVLNYAQHLSPIGTDHDRIIPEFDKQVQVAIEKIGAALDEAELLEENERQLLLKSISLLHERIQESRTNIDFFLGTLERLPQIPGTDKAVRIRDRVSQSLAKAINVFQTIERKLLLLIDDISKHK